MHTPGPWFRDSAGAIYAALDNGDSNSLIAFGAADADAKLIAAAPEMLAACDELLAAMHALESGGDETAMRLAIGKMDAARLQTSTAIAKAKGDAPGNDTKKKLDKAGESRYGLRCESETV